MISLQTQHFADTIRENNRRPYRRGTIKLLLYVLLDVLVYSVTITVFQSHLVIKDIIGIGPFPGIIFNARRNNTIFPSSTRDRSLNAWRS